MRCRRCNSVRLVELDIIHPNDNRVIRCRECGFLFSPGGPARSPEPGYGAVRQERGE